MKRIPSLGLVLATFVLACSAPVTDAPYGEPTPREEAPPVAVDRGDTEASAVAPIGPALASKLVFHAGGRTFVALDEHPDLALAVAAPVVVGDTHEGVVAVSRGADEARLAKEHTATIGTRVRLRNATGAVCEAIVEGVSFVGRVAPSGESELLWAGEARDEDDVPIPAPTREAIAEEAWDMAEGSVVLAASLRPVGSCKDATYTVDGARALGVIGEASDATTRDALVALRALPTYAAHAAEYLAFATETESSQTAPRWENHAESNARVTRITLDGAGYVFVAAGNAAGCGDFGAEMAVLFRETDGGLEVVRVLDGFSGTLEGLVLTDDGPELVFEESHAGAHDETVRRLEVRTFGCSC